MVTAIFGCQQSSAKNPVTRHEGWVRARTFGSGVVLPSNSHERFAGQRGVVELLGFMCKGAVNFTLCGVPYQKML